MSTQTHTFEIGAVARALEQSGAEGLADFLADDVEWTEVDQRTPPASPAVHHGREPVLELFREAEERGVRSAIDDGFVAGDRAAFTLRCTYPSGEAVLGNALCRLRAGKIVRWSAVQAWDG
jgi:ketosteroid isomerase-like protein